MDELLLLNLGLALLWMAFLCRNFLISYPFSYSNFRLFWSCILLPFWISLLFSFDPFLCIWWFLLLKNWRVSVLFLKKTPTWNVQISRHLWRKPIAVCLCHLQHLEKHAREIKVKILFQNICTKIPFLTIFYLDRPPANWDLWVVVT